MDVDDCVNAARYLVDRGAVDGKRLAIAGGSAGDYTTLCTLAFRDVFSAGASYYGIGLKREKVGIGKVLLFNTFCHSILHRLL
jgi:dipeptidyl aminopeptidase/acylaminoacyl peptidase